MKRCLTQAVIVMLALVFFHVQTGFAQTSDEIKAMQAEIKTLKEGQAAMQKDLQEIKKLVQTKQAPPPFKETIINIQDAPTKGDKTAKLVLMEFSDYQ